MQAGLGGALAAVLSGAKGTAGAAGPVAELGPRGVSALLEGLRSAAAPEGVRGFRGEVFMEVRRVWASKGQG